MTFLRRAARSLAIAWQGMLWKRKKRAPRSILKKQERRKADAAERALDEERQRTAKAAADEVARLEPAKAALIANGVTDEELARAIVLAIAAGSIPHVTITF